MPCIRKLFAKVHETGVIVNMPRFKRARIQRIPKNIKAVSEAVLEVASK